jgi:hypothetical protein
MKHAASISAILLALVITLPQCTRANGPGAGHGVSGGHGSSGHAGHAGHSSGNSSGHSPSHAFAHIFAHHGKTPPASDKMLPPKPKWFAVGQPIGFLPQRRHFGSSPCWNNLFSPRSASRINCFDNNFFFDPFFFGSFSILGAMPDYPGSAYAVNSGLDEEVPDPGNNSPSANANPVTLLQLLDGSMYGLTSYQVIGHDLHYTTTYGGQNSIPLDRIDFTQTLKLNAERQVPFTLEPKSTPN